MAASSDRDARQPRAADPVGRDGVAAVVLRPVVAAQVHAALVSSRRPRDGPGDLDVGHALGLRADVVDLAPLAPLCEQAQGRDGVLDEHPVPHLAAVAPHRQALAAEGPSRPPRHGLLGVLPRPDAVGGAGHDDVDPVGVGEREVVGERLRAGVGAGRETLARDLLVLPERIGGAGAVHLVGGHVHDPARADGRGGVEHRAGAGDVGVEEDLRRVLAPSHVRLGCEVHDERRLLGPDELLQLGRRHIEAHGLDDVRRRAGNAALVAGVRVEIGVQHRLAVGRQAAHERRADEAKPARDEHPPAHGSSIPAPASGSIDARAWARKRRTSSASYPGSTTARPALATNIAAVRPCTNRSAAAPWCFRA